MATRRNFLWKCSAFAASAAVLPPPAFAGALHGRGRETHLDDISAETFASHVNTRFVCRDAAGNAVSLLLATVEPAQDSASMTSLMEESQEQFSLIFVGSPSQRLGQNTYTFEHGRLGRFEIFIVPVGKPASDYLVYEAVFDRPRPAFRGRHNFVRGRN